MQKKENRELILMGVDSVTMQKEENKELMQVGVDSVTMIGQTHYLAVHSSKRHNSHLNDYLNIEIASNIIPTRNVRLTNSLYLIQPQV